jgi:hypothetical protein
MRGRLQRFLPVVLIALAMQIIAPVVACWAVAIAVSDPLQSAAAICHDGAGPGQRDQGDGGSAHDGLCAACATHSAAAAGTPEPTNVAVLHRHAETLTWLRTTAQFQTSRAGSNAQARAPPQLT